LAPFVLLLLLACGPAESPLEPVIVPDTQAPTAVADVLDASGAVDPDGRAGFGDAFSLDGARSTDAGGGRIVEYVWSLPDGSAVETANSRLAVTDRVNDPFTVGVHAFGLTVTDDSGNESAPATVTVTVVDTQAPTAVPEVLDVSGAVDADGRIPFGEAFSLDGSNSTDVGGQIVRYEWTLPDGAAVVTDTPTLGAPDIVTTDFTVGRHEFELTVTDDSGNESAPVQATVIVVDTQAPTAVLEVLDASGAVDADGRIPFGEAFSLSASRSVDVGGQITKYEWILPDGRTVALLSPVLAVTDVVTTEFTVGRYEFELTVTDDSNNESAPATVTVIVAAVDTQAPTAVLDLRDALGRQIVDGRIESGAAFSLDGARSVDVGGQIAQYDWSLPDGTTVTTVESSLAVTTTFPLGQHTFGLTVIDDSGNTSGPAQLTVIVVDTQAPTAVLQATDVGGRPLNRDVRIGSAFSLSGRRSVDSGGLVVRYDWSLPDGKTIATTAPTLTIPGGMTTSYGVGLHTFGLTVTDDSGNESTLAQVTVPIVF